MMLRATNIAGTTIYPKYKAGQLEGAKLDKRAFTVFVPDGPLEGDDWACTVENCEGVVVIETAEDLALLITALEIAYERIRAKNPHFSR